MLSSSLREALFACFPSPWNQPSFSGRSLFPLLTSTLILLFLAKVRLSHLSISRFELMASFLFLFRKGGTSALANCSLCSATNTSFYSAGLMCLSFFAEACTILLALRWSWHQHVCHFFLHLKDSCSILATFSSSPPFYITLSGASGKIRNFFLSRLLDYHRSTDTHFFRVTTRPTCCLYPCFTQHAVKSDS